MEAGDKRRRRWRAFLLLTVLTLLVYPALLVTSTSRGLAAGLRHDVDAQRALLRSLNYAGDIGPEGGFGTDSGQPGVAPIDQAALLGQLGAAELQAEVQPDQVAPSPEAGSQPGQGGGGAAPAGQVTLNSTPPAGSEPAPGRGPTPTSAPTTPPSGQPSPQPSATATPAPTPTATPAPSPTATPVPSPTPCPSPPTGNGKFNGQVRNPANNNNVGGATVKIYYNGCLVDTATSAGDGHLTSITNLAPNTAYTYIATAPGYSQTTGTFTTANDGNENGNIVMNP